MNDCLPRWATARTIERPTMGVQASKIAALLGTPLMPWQRQVFDVALEQDPETGLYVYRNVIVTVPRQNGKTTLILVLVLLRALSQIEQQIRYSAQHQTDAKKKFINDWLPMLRKSQFARYYSEVLANGNEAMKFQNGSLMTLVATTKTAGRGSSIDLGIIDEAFSLKDGRMEQTFVPAMKTRTEPQLWVTSTAGPIADAVYLYGKCMTGRKLVEDGVNAGTCYFEWSAEDDADPSSPETWASCNPALGITVSLEAMRADYQSMDLRDFETEDLNKWVQASTQPVIDLDTWDAMADATSSTTGQVAVAFDVSPDRSHASIAICGRRSDGNFHVRVIRSEPGTTWLAPSLAKLWHEDRPVGIWLDRNGPAGSVITELQNLNVPLVNDVPVSDLTKACGLFYDGVMGNANKNEKGTLYHRGDDIDLALRDSLDNAVRRPVSDAWVWDRKHSEVDISPLVAATMAYYGAKQSSRTPQVFSIREIMEEKQRAAAAKETVTEAIESSDDFEVIEFADVTQPQPAAPLSGVRRVPI